MNDHSSISVPLGDLPSGGRVELGKPTPTPGVECFAVRDFKASHIWGGGYSKPGNATPGFLIVFNPPLPTDVRADYQAVVALLYTDIASSINGWTFFASSDSQAPRGSVYAPSMSALSARSIRIAVRRVKFHTEEDILEFPNCQLVSKFGGTGFKVDTAQSFKTPTGWQVTLPQQYSGPFRNVKQDSRAVKVDLAFRPPPNANKLPDGSRRPNYMSTFRDSEAEQFVQAELVSPTAAELGLSRLSLVSRTYNGSPKTSLVRYGSFTLKLRIKTTSVKDLGTQKLVLPVKPYKG